MTVSVVLPTYNEKDNIISLIRGIKKVLKGKKYEIIVVDDNSPDGTWKAVEDYSINDKTVSLVKRLTEKGLTSAIREGVANCNGDVVIWMDTDLSMPPNKIPDLLRMIDAGYDMAVASRYVPGGGMVIIEKSEDSFLSAVLSFVMNYAIQKLLDSSFKDYTSGFVALKREVLNNIKLRGDYGEYFIELVYRAILSGYRIIEIPYICQARQYGVSKTGRTLSQYMRRGIKYVWTALRLRVSTLY